MTRTEANPTPQVLVKARESAGLPLGLAARKVGVTAERLRAWEHGERRPTDAQLRKLGTIYNWPLAALHLSEPPTGSNHRVVAPQVVRKATQQHPLPTAEEESLSREKKLAERVARKLDNPKGNPVMTVEEVAFVFERSPKTIYRWIDEGKLHCSNAPGRILTSSVLALLRPKIEAE
jgi:transcriptional regulator with XRE-family HTH domain